MFVSFFFPIYLGIVVALFFVLPRKWRPTVLLVSSYIFCGYIDLKALAVLINITICTWISGILIEKSHITKIHVLTKSIAILAVLVGVFLMCLFKYTESILLRFHMDDLIPESVLSNLVMPIGMSFYLFQAIAYVVDVYKKKCPAEKNFIYFGCYMGFFAKLISGPIEREQGFILQLRRLEQVRFYDRGRLSSAFTYMLWGYFMKMVVADRLAITVSTLFAEPTAFDSFWLVMGAFFYTVQIYCDFAGYSYIAIGCAKIFGLNLTQNFKEPYCARTVSDFWRRWHISLSSWLRDYIYIPLGGNRKGLLRQYANVMFVFLVCGMWHGAGLNFVFWGLLHGCYQVVEKWMLKLNKKYSGNRILTFLAVAFAWIFFRAGSFRDACAYIETMFTAGFRPNHFLAVMDKLHLSIIEIVIIVIGILIVWIVDVHCNKKHMSLPELIQQKQNATRYFIFYLIIIAIFIFGIYGPGYQTEQFIYMQF